MFISTSNLASEQIKAASPKLHKEIAQKGRTSRADQQWRTRTENSSESGWTGLLKASLVDAVFGIDLCTDTGSALVVEKLVKGYDMNYGARSILNAIRALAGNVTQYTRSLLYIIRPPRTLVALMFRKGYQDDDKTSSATGTHVFGLST